MKVKNNVNTQTNHVAKIKIGFFTLGMITGIVLTILWTVIVSNYSTGSKHSNSDIPGLTLFKQPTKNCVGEKSAQVVHVVDTNFALVQEEDEDFEDWYTGKTMLITNEAGTPYYDGQIIRAAKCFRQVGVYKFEFPAGITHVAPVVVAE